MNLNKFLTWFIGGILIFGAVAAFILYRAETDKNTVLRSEGLKTLQEAQVEVKKLNSQVEEQQKKNLEDKQKLLDQMTASLKERDNAVREAEGLKKSFYQERELSLVANDDLDKLRSEVAKLKKESREGIASLENSVKKKKQVYETRILSLEAQLEKAKARLNSEAARYHYNLGVVYTQNKDFDSAVTELKTALGFNPNNAQAHYNLGIIYDDYFKDKENAKYHYRTFLELKPTSDDAESVKEWLDALNK